MMFSKFASAFFTSLLLTLSGFSVGAAELKKKEFDDLVTLAQDNLGSLIACEKLSGDSFDVASKKLDLAVLKMVESYGINMESFQDIHYDKVTVAAKVNRMSATKAQFCRDALEFKDVLINDLGSATKKNRRQSR